MRQMRSLFGVTRLRCTESWIEESQETTAHTWQQDTIHHQSLLITSRVAVEGYSSVCVMCLTYGMGYVIIPKPNVSSREGTNSRCRRFYLLVFAVLVQSFAAMIAVVSVHVVAVSTCDGVACDPVNKLARPN